MKKFTSCLLLLSIIFLVNCIGCKSMRCYEIKGHPIICVDDMSKVHKKAKKLIVTGAPVLCTIVPSYANPPGFITSFYTEENNILYTVNDLNTVLTQLWFIKNDIQPQWDVDSQVFKIEMKKY